MSKYKIQVTNRFKKEYKKIRTRNNFDEDAFVNVIKILANGENLPEKYCNHLLEPKKNGIWECHIKPDLLLIYMKNDNVLILTLISTGSHSDLFK